MIFFQASVNKISEHVFINKQMLSKSYENQV